MKRGIVILGLISAISLSACGSIPVLNSSSDDSEVIAQSKAVIEQSKAVEEESEAVEKAKGNKDIVEENLAIEETEQVKESEQIKESEQTQEESHPLAILEYQGKRYDMANMTCGEFVILLQNMGSFPDIDLGKKMEPYSERYYTDLSSIDFDEDNGIMGHIYNPYNKELQVKDTKFDSISMWDIPDGLYMINNKAANEISPEEWVDAFEEYGISPYISYSSDGTSILEINGIFTLKDGREAELDIDCIDGISNLHFGFSTSCYFYN